MHKIKLGRAPKFISQQINFNDFPHNNNILKTPILNTNQLRRLERLGISQTNVVTRVSNTTEFAKEPETGLTVHRYCFTVRGPKLYNYFVSKVKYFKHFYINKLYFEDPKLKSTFY